MKNNHITTLEIDLNAIDFNFNYFKSKLQKTTKIIVVVKAFGYGTSSVKIAKFLEKKVDYFAVAYLDEGIALRNAGIKNSILILNPQKNNFKQIIKYHLEPNIYSINLLKTFIEISKELKLQNFPIHLKFNTGLNRLGFTINGIPEITSLINNQKEVAVKSVFSHIAASEDLKERAFTLQQINTFNSVTRALFSKLKTKPFKHILNTSGIINYAKEAQFDMVRLGIGLYGFGNAKNETKKLKNVVVLKSIISQIHIIEKGDTVSYNRGFKATSTTKIATIPAGYADGISRLLGNTIGYVYVNSQKAPIIGTICMDMLMINISGINCNEGDAVFIYKNQQHIESIAKTLKTIPYEILTSISQRVKRVLKK
ncbi:alanine racemase [Lutibacter sp.]